VLESEEWGKGIAKREFGVSAYEQCAYGVEGYGDKRVCNKSRKAGTIKEQVIRTTFIFMGGDGLVRATTSVGTVLSIPV